jgi:5'-3' exoribonuclease 1
MTGKKNPWEGIVLVPFIDQHRLLAACSTIPESSITPKENERNKLGCSHELMYPKKEKGKGKGEKKIHLLLVPPYPSFLFTPHIYAEQSHGKWISPAPYLSDIQDCRIFSTPYQLPPLSPGTNPFHLLPGAKTGLDSPSGFATLKTSTFTPTYVHAKVNVSLIATPTPVLT